MKSMNAAVLLLVVSSALVSCSEEKKTVRQYGNTLMQASKTAKTFDKKLNVQQVQKSIQEFNAANGRFPADLGELSSFGGLALKNDDYEYNPATGALTERNN